MNNGDETVDTQSRKEPAAAAELPAPLQRAALLPHAPQTGEYSLIQLEVLSGIALKQATRELPLSSTAD
ncbi:MAG TPA: hypothetical protein VFP33_01595 [Gallionella sp.]|nr:hypothetical protein [Gallionella sp.]